MIKFLIYDLIIVFVMYCISFFAGIPIKWILNKEKITISDFILLPWGGLFFIMLLGYYFSLLGISVLNSYIIVTCIIVIYTGVFLFRDKKGTITIPRQDFFYIISIITIVTLFFVFPCVVNNNNVFPIMFGNNDYILYHDISSFIQNSSIKDIGSTKFSIFVAQWIKGSQTRHLCYMISFFSSLLHVKIMILQFLFLIYIFCLSLMTFGEVFKNLKIPQYVIMVFQVLILLNSNYQWLIYQGFISQLFCVGIFILIYMIFVSLLHKPAIEKGIILGLFMLCAEMSYSDMMAFIIFPLTVLICYNAIKRQINKKTVYSIIAALITVGLLNPLAYYDAVKQLVNAGLAKVGWNITRSYLIRLIGLSNTFHADMVFNLPNNYKIIREIFEIIISFVVLWRIGLFLRKKIICYKDKAELEYTWFLSLFICLLSFSVLYFLLFCFNLFNIISLYKMYKALISMGFVFIIAVFYCFYEMGKRNVIYKILLVCCGVMIFITGLINPMINYAYSTKIGEKTYPACSFTCKEHYALDLEVANNNSFWLDIYPLQWDEHYAISQIEENGHQWHSLYKNSLWSMKKKNRDDLPQIGDIYIGSSRYRNPIYYGDDVIFENEIYNVRSFSGENPFCIDFNGLSAVCRINRGFYLNDNLFYLDAGRWLTEEKSNIIFYSNNKKEKDVYIELYNADSHSHSISISYNNQQKEVILQRKETKMILLSNFMFFEGENSIQICCDKPTAVMLTDLSFGQTPPRNIACSLSSIVSENKIFLFMWNNFNFENKGLHIIHSLKNK